MLIWLRSPRWDLLSWDQRFQALGSERRHNCRQCSCCSKQMSSCVCAHKSRMILPQKRTMLLCNFSAWPALLYLVTSAFLMIWQTYEVHTGRWHEIHTSKSITSDAAETREQMYTTGVAAVFMIGFISTVRLCFLRGGFWSVRSLLLISSLQFWNYITKTLHV